MVKQAKISRFNTLAQPLRAMVREIDSSAILSSITTMQSELSPRRFQTTVLSLFSFVALLLAGVGIYGVLGYSVTRRTHEMGIRMALGARPRDMVKLILKDGAGSRFWVCLSERLQPRS